VSDIDAGAQAERTLLSWRRTCLSFVVASAVALRLTVEMVGIVALLFGSAGVLLAGGAYAAVWLRYRRARRSLTEAGAPFAGGMALALAAGAALSVGLVCAAFIVHQALR
jgi:uncharacterized membrane protein YidH (DUF202 family)